MAVLIGEDIGVYGGAFKITRGFVDTYGDQRVIDTPISEAGFVSVACGAALMGSRPIVEIMFMGIWSSDLRRVDPGDDNRNVSTDGSYEADPSRPRQIPANSDRRAVARTQTTGQVLLRVSFVDRHLATSLSFSSREMGAYVGIGWQMGRLQSDPVELQSDPIKITGKSNRRGLIRSAINKFSNRFLSVDMNVYALLSDLA